MDTEDKANCKERLKWFLKFKIQIHLKDLLGQNQEIMMQTLRGSDHQLPDRHFVAKCLLISNED